MPQKTALNSRSVGSLLMRATFQPSTANAEKRTVDVVWTTGARVLRRDWDGSFYEELSLDPKHVRMDRLNNGAPFLANHDGYDVRATLGVIVPGSAKLVGNEGVATVRFAAADVDPEAEAVFRKIQDGIIQNVSVGYRVHKMEKVEGGDSKTPVYRAVDWEPYEISAVAMGADDGAGFRSFTKQESSMDPEEIKRAAELKAAQEKQQAEEARQAEIKAAKDQAAKAERERSAGIRHAVRVAKLGDAFAEKMINDGTSLEQARATVLEEMAKRSDAAPIDGHSGVEVVVEERTKSMRGAQAALIQRYGLDDLVRRVKDRKDLPVRIARAFADVETDPGEFGGMRPLRIAQEFLERSGRSTRRMSDDQILDAAFSMRSGENTTSDYSTLLANLMYKQSLGQYALADDTWRRFCKTDTVQDFRPSNRYRIGTFGTLEVVPEGGEFKNKSIPDGLKFSITAQTKGAMLALSRQALINDDMGAVLATAGEFGRSAGLSIESDVYALLNANSGLGADLDDSTPFFDASRGNVNATGSALGVDAIEADRVVMAEQKDPSSNEYLNLRPSVLLVPVGIGGQAKVINRMEYDNTSSVFQMPNKVRGLFREVVDTPRLTDTKRRYLFTDPGDAAAIVVAFLNGEQAPMLQQQLGWRTDGIEWKLRIDYKAQFFDPKGAVTNAGQ